MTTFVEQVEGRLIRDPAPPKSLTKRCPLCFDEGLLFAEAKEAMPKSQEAPYVFLCSCGALPVPRLNFPEWKYPVNRDYIAEGDASEAARIARFKKHNALESQSTKDRLNLLFESELWTSDYLQDLIKGHGRPRIEALYREYKEQAGREPNGPISQINESSEISLPDSSEEVMDN